MKHALTASFSGLLFGIGLVLSGMADPANVLGFLTLDVHWNPSLALVMAGALSVALPGFAWVRRRARPWLGGTLVDPQGPVDRRLLAGAAIFGLGWGLSGYCPGPALIGVSLLQPAALVFVPAMLLGASFARRL